MEGFIKRQWPLFGIFILVALFCFYVFKSDFTASRDNLVDQLLPGKGLRVNDFCFVQNDPDKDMTWTINAKEMLSLEGKNTFEFHDFRIKVTPKVKPPFALSGKKGRYSRESAEINLEGNLVGTLENGYKLFTERLTIHEKDKLISTDAKEPVKLIGPFFSVAGNGLLVDLENETAKILSQVSAVIHKGLPTG